MTSSKVPYVIVGSAIGGAAAYFLFTESGRRVAASVRNMDSTTIPEKMEKLRGVIDRRAQEVSNRVEHIRGRFNESVDEGRRTYDESGQQFQTRLRQLEECNGRFVAGIHKSIDELNRTVYTFEKSIMRPVAQVLALAQAVQQGVRKMRSEPRLDVRDNLDTMFDREHVGSY
jgi:gas vesicle protein